MYGHAYTPQTISNISKAVEVHVEQFHNRPLSKRYIVIYGDATSMNVRRGTVAKEMVHILVGITSEGYKEVLDYQLFPQETCGNYEEMLLNIRSRGVEDVLLFVTDGLIGLRERCLEVFPNAQHQSCWVHIQRNVVRKVRAADKREITDLLKPVYQASDITTAKLALSTFLEAVSGRYPKVLKMFEDMESLFSFLLFPKAIQRSLYTTNLIEGINKQLKRKTKRKEQFPNEASLDRFVCQYMLDYNHRFQQRVHKGFEIVQAEIHEMFDQLNNSETEAAQPIQV